MRPVEGWQRRCVASHRNETGWRISSNQPTTQIEPLGNLGNCENTNCEMQPPSSGLWETAKIHFLLRKCMFSLGQRMFSLRQCMFSYSHQRSPGTIWEDHVHVVMLVPRKASLLQISLMVFGCLQHGVSVRWPLLAAVELLRSEERLEDAKRKLLAEIAEDLFHDFDQSAS